MNPVAIFTGYLTWHYSKAFLDLSVVWRNLFWFVIHFFSIPTLIKTFFSPWKRIHEDYQKRSLEVFFQSLVVNIVTRILGAIIRFSVILLGILAFFMLFVSFVGFIIFWVVAPVAPVVFILAGIALL